MSMGYTVKLCMTEIEFKCADRQFFGQLHTFLCHLIKRVGIGMLIVGFSSPSFAAERCSDALKDSFEEHPIAVSISEKELLEQPWLFPLIIKKRLQQNPHLSLVEIEVPEMLPQIQLMIKELGKAAKPLNAAYAELRAQALRDLSIALRSPKYGIATLAIIRALASLTPKTPDFYKNSNTPFLIEILQHKDRDKFILVDQANAESRKDTYMISADYPVAFTSKMLSEWDISKIMDFYAIIGVTTAWVKADGRWMSPIEFAFHDFLHASDRFKVESKIDVSRRAHFWRSLQTRISKEKKTVQKASAALVYSTFHETGIDLLSSEAVEKIREIARLRGKRNTEYYTASDLLTSAIQSHMP